MPEKPQQRLFLSRQIRAVLAEGEATALEVSAEIEAPCRIVGKHLCAMNQQGQVYVSGSVRGDTGHTRNVYALSNTGRAMVRLHGNGMKECRNA